MFFDEKPVGIIAIVMNRETGEMTIADDTELDKNGNLKPFISRPLAELSASFIVKSFFDSLTTRPDVDNIWMGRKCFDDDDEDVMYATIMYHEYAEGEKPSFKDPNREKSYLIATADQINKWIKYSNKKA